MKRLLIITAIAGVMALTAHQANAQVSINVNIGAQPRWLPAGYQNVNYYYLPDIQSYYYVPQRQFVYMHNNVWTRSSYLPARYRNYDLNRGRMVVFRGNTPFGYANVRPYRYVSTGYYRNNGNHYGQYRNFREGRDKNYGHHNGRGHDGRGRH